MGGGAREGDATALPSQMRYKPDVYGEQLAGSMCVRLVELQPSQQAGLVPLSNRVSATR
jgi:hypothetical protein